jgi:predicted ferric reductase
MNSMARSNQSDQSLRSPGSPGTPLLAEEGALMAPQAAKKETVFKLVGATMASLVLTMTAFALWTQAEDFNKPESKRHPTPSGDPYVGFTTAQNVWLFVFTLLAPWTFIGIVMSALHLTWHMRPATAMQRRVGILAAAAVSFVLGVLGVVRAWDLLKCGVVACVNTAKYPYPGLDHFYLLGTGWNNTTGIWMAAVGFGCCIALCFSAFDEQVSRWPRQVRPRSPASIWVGLAAATFLLLGIWWASLWMPNAFPRFASWMFAADAAKRTECTPANALHCPENSWAFFVTKSVKWSDALQLNLYPGNMFYMSYLLLMLLAGSLIHATRTGRSVMRRRVVYHKSVGNVTVGLLLGWSITALMLLLFCIYWLHDHQYPLTTKKVGKGTGENVAAERWARGLGQIAVLTLSLLLFPAARTSVIHTALGTSWEQFIYAHRLLGGLSLACMFGHMVAWYKLWSNLGQLGHLWFSMPYAMPTHTDNFTIGPMILTTFIVFTAMGVLAYEPIRRKCFELFYYSHLVAAYALIPATLLHAHAAWQYMLPSLTIWFIDRLIRLSRSSRRVEGATLRAITNEYTEVRFTGGVANFAAGQFVFINVPAVSMLEWHPFTLSSDGALTERTLHIKNMGEGTFTARLNELAGRGHGEAVAVDCFVDGPYGAQRPDFDDFDAVLLVAGGIGITPCAAIAHQLTRPMPIVLSSTKVADTKLCGLVWSVRGGGAIAEAVSLPMPTDTVTVTQGTRFIVRGFNTKPSEDCQRYAPMGWTFLNGERPDVGAELAAMLPAGILPEKVLVFGCGPAPLVEAACTFAAENNYNFHSEVFEL